LHSVTSYNISSATLTLEHNFHPGNEHKALVDVKLLVETLKSSDTQTGEWVNVMGYVTMRSDQKAAVSSTSVQAIVVWSAGPVKLDEYEKTLTERLQLPS
jgi:hypothetical protein